MDWRIYARGVLCLCRKIPLLKVASLGPKSLTRKYLNTRGWVILPTLAQLTRCISGIWISTAFGIKRKEAPQLANTQASCSKQAARATPKGSLRLLCAIQFPEKGTFCWKLSSKWCQLPEKGPFSWISTCVYVEPESRWKTFVYDNRRRRSGSSATIVFSVKPRRISDYSA
jgi:hypothetical protein